LTIAILFLLVFLVLPVVLVFTTAFRDGFGAYGRAISDPVTIASVRLTLFVALCAVPLNTVFGVAAAWTIGKFEFPGRRLFAALLDVPFGVSPVISGLVFVVLLGAHSTLGQWLDARGIKVIFAIPGLVIATMFVTVPYVARELIPLVQSQRSDAEEAALTLGASGWQMFFRVSLPKMRWGLLYGVILCNARAVGEFGAVSVVSGHVRGHTTTIPLAVEMLYNEYEIAAAFSVASLLTLLAFATLVAKSLLEWRAHRRDSTAG
jgi:sulfate transport system permease protein